MSSLLSAELSATCNALGTFDKRNGKYLIDDFTLNTVKDLIRYLRRDGEDHEIRRHFGQTKVLQTDLIPMLIDHWENDELFDVTLRLLVNLTNPALLLYREEVPVERTARHNFLQILQYLQSYKEETFTKVETWTLFAKKLAKVLEIDWSERDEDTGLIIERILILIRNVLHVPADLDKERRPENDASIHDQVLWSLNQSGILDIILYMSSENEKQYFMHILEIISHLLREQNPTSLANSALQRSVDEKLRDEQELLTMRNAENKQRTTKIKQYSLSRHSRFGGTYVVQNIKSISDNEMICLKPLTNISKLDFNVSKKDKYVKPKNRRPVESGVLERRSAFAVRLFLKEFCIEFLNSSYNPLMHYVKDVLVRARAQQNDESYYLWAVKFFMEFNRGHDFKVGLVSETMSVPMFHFVQQQMEKYYDMIKVEKKKFAPWVRRLHLALRAYKELLNTLQAMDKSTDGTVKDSAKVIKSNIFYVLEYREFILSTFLNYDDNKMPRSYLLDLVETVHLFLKMLEIYCKKTGLVVQKKVRKKPSKSKKRNSTATKSKSAPNIIPPPPWEEIRPQLAAVFTSGVNEYPPPFDAASDTPIDEQRADCMKKIQKFMRDHKFEDAIGTFRAAREVWPEEGIFGVAGMPEDEELEMLETIYNADLGIPDEIEQQPEIENENSEYDDDEEEDEEEEQTSASIVETDFNFLDFVSRFCHPRVVSACSYLLEQYDKNLPHTNHCIVKMLHRVAWDCQRPAMMFQGTLFIVFQKIIAERLPQFKELEKFAVFIIRKFTEVASKTPKAFIELLFWKNTKDAAEIQHGYDLYNDARDKPGKNSWTEEQEEELRKLYMENQTNPETNQDVIDWILDNLIDSRSRTRRSVISKLKELGLIFKAPTKKYNKDRVKDKVPIEFGEEEDEMLRGLWETYGESIDPMSAIMSRMPRKRPKHRLVDRLLELGIIQDKKQCRKKRQKKNKDDDRRSGSENSSDSDSSSSESDHSPVRTKTKPDKPQKDKQNAKKRQPRAPVLSASEIAKLLVKAVDENHTEALRWLAESLEEVALDQEAEGFDPEAEGVPLVPLSGDCVEAMNNKLFQNVLKAVGVKPPSDEQETYWRIPSSLHFETIRKRRELIIKAVNKELIIEDDATPLATNIDEPDKDSESSNDDDLFNNLRKMRENSEQMPTKSQQKSRKRSHSSSNNEKKKKMQRIDEDDESSAGKSDSEKENLGKKNKRNVLSDSSDDDVEQITRKRTIDETFDSIRSSPSKNVQTNDDDIPNMSIDTDSNSKNDDDDNFGRIKDKSNKNSDDENDTISISKREINRSIDNNKKRKVFDDSSDDDNDSGKKSNDIDNDGKTNYCDEDDILSFAKKTLEHDDVPDTEDILREIRRNISDDSDEDNAEIRPKKPEKRRRIIIDDDSD